MKKIFLFLGLLALPCAEAAAEKKIQMVTYFPTPYVAYSEVQATDTLDVGLTGTCEMTLGCGASTLALKASSAVGVQKGTFDLNAAGRVQSETVKLGKGGGEGTFNFNADLVVTTLKDGQSVEATNMQVDKLYLFPSHTKDEGRFPKCDDITMSWQKLRDNQTYLVCGAVKEPQECTSHPYYTQEGSASYNLGYGATINVAEVLSILSEEKALCCSGNKITDKDGTEPPETYMDAIEKGKLCCNPKLCCTAGGDSSGSSTQCTSDFTNPYALKGAVSGWACGGDTQVFFYSCTGKGSTEPVCHWNSGKKVEHKNQMIDYQAGELFEKAGGDFGPETVEPVSLRDVADYHDTCTTGACSQGKTCVVNYTLSNCSAVGDTTSDGKTNVYSCTFTHTEKTCECN